MGANMKKSIFAIFIILSGTAFALSSALKAGLWEMTPKRQVMDGLDPVPPLDRQDCDSVQIDPIVQMITRGQAGLSRVAENLPLRDRIADLAGAVLSSRAMERLTITSILYFPLGMPI